MSKRGREKNRLVRTVQRERAVDGVVAELLETRDFGPDALDTIRPEIAAAIDKRKKLGGNTTLSVCPKCLYVYVELGSPYVSITPEDPTDPPIEWTNSYRTICPECPNGFPIGVGFNQLRGSNGSLVYSSAPPEVMASFAEELLEWWESQDNPSPEELAVRFRTRFPGLRDVNEWVNANQGWIGIAALLVSVLSLVKSNQGITPEQFQQLIDQMPGPTPPSPGLQPYTPFGPVAGP